MFVAMRTGIDDYFFFGPGTLFKSNSFNASNSKPKVRLVDEVVPEKQKAGKEHVYLDTKERSGRLIGKSMSISKWNQ